ncbi:hypothetical protein B0T18DRAFT_485236 [Schizothecium vesticola]|uniref:Uncharacterized protein n=1 Tax=Schizothecium vesticola TaxID=314040 RepID=A0AA40KDG5_9PEZI|nr:hypothetical protein B0T18DRAFT_485236 [Schizothecium vesticola]
MTTNNNQLLQQRVQRGPAQTPQRAQVARDAVLDGAASEVEVQEVGPGGVEAGEEEGVEGFGCGGGVVVVEALEEDESVVVMEEEGEDGDCFDAAFLSAGVGPGVISMSRREGFWRGGRGGGGGYEGGGDLGEDLLRHLPSLATAEAELQARIALKSQAVTESQRRRGYNPVSKATC